MSIVIKQASIDDVEPLSRLFNAYRIFYEQESNLPLANEFLKERLQNAESVIFFASNNKGEYLGFTQLYASFSSVSARRIWVLNDLYITPSARRLGIARQLMLAAQEFAQSTGSKGIALETAQDNTQAQALYGSLGYKKSSGVYHYFLTLENNEPQ
jgi:ribosomal protein S18 acetylase RimI-like enzyme